MASTVSYGMGQIRSTNVQSKYMNPISMKAESIITSSATGAQQYRDILIYPVENGSFNNTSFSNNESYYLRLGLPPNLSYDMVFDLKLLKSNGSGDEVSIENRSQYQEIKRFVLPKYTSGDLNSSRVLIYPENADGTIPIEQDEAKNAPVIKVAIAIEDPTLEQQNNAPLETVFYYNNTQTYEIKKSNGLKKIGYRDDRILSHVWKTSTQEEKVYFEFIFSNKVTDVVFNSILLELNRNAYDDDISYIYNGQSYNGLFINPDNMTVECYRLVNLIGLNSIISETNMLSSIGVWSHPDTIMSINGEEIRIGQSGYYELNDFNISNFGIVYRDEQDRFSIDYQYKAE